jgi:HEAT repeat protein
VSCNSPSGAQTPTTHEFLRELAQDGAAGLKALASAAGAEDQFERRTAIEAIGRHPEGRGLCCLILKALGDPSEYVVRTACEAVARWELQEAHELMVPLLTHPSKATRQAAIRTLGMIWVEADFPTIFRIYDDASEKEIRREAALVLRRRVTSIDWRTLFDAFQIDELARHRQWACELAATFSGRETLPVLSRLSSDADGHVRKAALQAIQTLSSR